LISIYKAGGSGTYSIGSYVVGKLLNRRIETSITGNLKINSSNTKLGSKLQFCDGRKEKSVIVQIHV
jgi:hypothetical protein